LSFLLGHKADVAAVPTPSGNFWLMKSGATAIEYGLIAADVALLLSLS
jgi:hypothetical protein